MKILITGSYCSGKTTISRQLIEILEDATLVGEVTREILKLFDDIDWAIDELRDYVFIKQIIEEKKSILSGKSNIVIDAGIVSILAHDNILLKVEKDRTKLMQYFNHDKYDLIFYCDHTEIEIEDDGERYTSRNLRNDIAEQVIKSLHFLNYSNFIVLRGSKDERLSIALSHIKLFDNGNQKF